MGVPQNAVGWQEPHTGNAYVGIWLSDFTNNEYREYIQCQLFSPLETQQQYEISYYISRADSSTKACANVGVFLSETPIYSDNNLNLPYIPQVVSDPNTVIMDALNWTYIIDTITAVGGETYLTLGVFSNNTNTNWTNVSGGWMSEAYYYIDDVSVTKATTISVDKTHELTKSLVSIYPNPCNRTAEISSSEIIRKYSVFSSSGQLLNKSNVDGKRCILDVSEYAHGVYFVIIETFDTLIVRKLLINS